MALKYSFTSSKQAIVPSGTVEARADFVIKDDASEGKIKDGIPDFVIFTPTFPQTKASWRSNADTAVVAKYPGATPA